MEVCYNGFLKPKLFVKVTLQKKKTKITDETSPSETPKIYR